MQTSQLPFLDEHTTAIAAGADDVWPVLLETLDRSFTRAGLASYARIVGCANRTASGPRPFVVGSTVPGFRVVAAAPGAELVLAGRHRFSTYALSFRLEHVGAGRSLLRAESRAAFPGLAGSGYRLLVVGTGGHVIAVRRLLAQVRNRCEVGQSRGDVDTA